MAPPALAELVLSSTHPNSPLPTTQLYDYQTGALVFSWRHPTAGTGVISSKSEDSSVSSKHRKRERTTAQFVSASNGVGAAILALGGKEGRNGVLSVWGLQKEQPLAKLIPPVKLCTICVSNTAHYLAGGTEEGTVFIWDLSTGTLLATIAAHYRPITVLKFTTDDAILITASADSGIALWSMGDLLSTSQAEASAQPTPYALLNDHTLPITAIEVGVGTFPAVRLLTADEGGTVKHWDLSANPVASLLTTFELGSPVSLLAWDALERFFFAVCDHNPGSTVKRVNMYKENDSGVESVGGSGVGCVVNPSSQDASDSIGSSYTTLDIVTAIHLSPYSPTIYLGTSATTIHILALQSLLPLRVIPAPATTISPGPITFLSSSLRSSEVGRVGALPLREVCSSGLGRIVGGPSGTPKIIKMRIGYSEDVKFRLFGNIKGPQVPRSRHSILNLPHVLLTSQNESSDKTRELEEENQSLKAQLAKATALNDEMWKKIVQTSMLEKSS